MPVRRRWVGTAATMVARVANAAGRDLVSRNYYSPIPAWQKLPVTVFERRSAMRGIRFNTDAQLAFLGELGPLLAEFELPAGFVRDNGMYGVEEANVLYAIIRRHRPKRIIELGSGFSSLVIAAAAERNAAEGQPVDYRAYDPYPRDFIRQNAGGGALRETSATDVPLEEFEALGEGDVLFVDTTHTVKLGSDVNYIVLDVLPALAPGVLVHVHDVYLPYEYPRGFFEQRLYWAEQYLLQAFLTQNAAWDVVLGLYALCRDRPDEVASLVRSFQPGVGPGAFWIRRKE